MTTTTEQLELLAKSIREAKNVVIMTGAGMSTPSGLKDFRSEGGMWKNKSVYDIANAESIRPRDKKEPAKDYKARIKTFTEFYQHRVKEVLDHEPNTGHDLLSQWEYKGYIKGIITQNTDGYHEKSGSTTLAIHGNVLDLSCVSCGRKATPWVYARVDHRCEMCAGVVRPGVVLFDEDLPPVFESAMTWALRSDFMLVLGTSLKVRPANQLPVLTTDMGGNVGVVSYNYSAKPNAATIVIKDKDVVEAIKFLNSRIYKSSYGF
jgi:NAD-dependent deacetylase